MEMSSLNLLGHALDKFGMVTVLDVTIYDMNNNPLLELDTLKISNISAEGSQKEIRGGQGADLLMQYDYARTANVEITDAFASMESLQYLWGGDLTTGNIKYHGKKRVTADGNPIQLDDIADPNGTVHVFNLTTKEKTEVQATDGSITTGEVGEELILYYTAVGDENSKELVLTSDDFPPVVKLVGKTFLIRYTDGQKIMCEIEIPKFKLGSNFEFTLEGEGDASVFDFSGVALATENGELIKIKTY